MLKYIEKAHGQPSNPWDSQEVTGNLVLEPAEVPLVGWLGPAGLVSKPQW